jgi:hypothetical protein
MVRAKFIVTYKTEGATGTVKLMAVYSGSEENKEFFLLTPSANISLSTVNEKAFAELEKGKEYYVDFTKAD